MQWFFLVFISVAWGILFLLHAFVYNSIARVFAVSLPYWQVILSLLALSYFFASYCVRMCESMISDWLYFAASTWLGIIFFTASLVLIYEVLRLITRADSPLILGIFLLGAILLSGFSLYAGRALTIREYVIPIKGLERQVKVVHLSDIHVGTVHQKKYLEEIVAKTNALSPDLVLITGDLFDGSANIDANILDPLNKFEAPAYFSNGNHEQYEGLDKVRETLNPIKLALLENTSVDTMSIQIIGVNDRQSLRDTSLDAILSALPNASNTPRILMYHSPNDWEVARKHGVDLMLSGHTHNGQVFPFTLLVKIFFRHIHGLYEQDEAFLHVSPGTGTWGPPMRLGSRNQITLLTLTPGQ